MTTTPLSSLGPAMAKLELHFLLNLSRWRLSLFLNPGLFSGVRDARGGRVRRCNLLQEPSR